jgi:hypothetical protein
MVHNQFNQQSARKGGKGKKPPLPSHTPSSTDGKNVSGSTGVTSSGGGGSGITFDSSVGLTGSAGGGVVRQVT